MRPAFEFADAGLKRTKGVAGQELRLRPADRRLWTQIGHLFGEFTPAASGRVASLRVDGGSPGWNPASGLVFSPGLLRGPGFTTAASWVSGTIVNEMGNAPADPPARRVTAGSLAGQMVAAEIGGHFWAEPLAEGAARIVLRPASPSALGGLLAEALASHDAAALLLLLPRRVKMIGRLERLGVAVHMGPVDPWSVLRRAREVWVGGDDELALLGVLAGAKVVCHAPGLAAGWGLTVDAPQIPRHGERTPADFAASVLVDGVRYADPRTRARIDCAGAISLLSEWQAVVRQNRAIGSCVGMAFWKRRRIAGFLHDGQRAPPFRRSAAAALRDAGGRSVAAWNSRLPAGLEAAAGRGQLLRVEDGFIRSSGLGSGFLPPASIIVDGRGIYYDPRRPSDLEHLLAETVFDAALRCRAARLIDLLNRRGVTKYAAGGAATEIAAPAGRRRILVPGQVADDLSVRLGAGAVRDNLGLLEHVRAANPQAWVIYKPHPDVEAGHRPGVVAEADLRRLADQVVREGAMSALIAAVDEVHTMTSLAGFEALLRGRAVTVLGQPFYTGWGLTTDLAPLARRSRRLSLEELVAGVLIVYPRYLDPASGLPCGPELLIARLEQPEWWRPDWLMRLRALQGKLNKRLQMR